MVLTPTGLGSWGERIARHYLTALGYTIVGTNIHCRFGELDLLCVDAGTLVGVEVKTRRSSVFGTPQEGVSEIKMLRLANSLSYWAERYQWPNAHIRLDCITLEQLGGAVYSLEHIRELGIEGAYDELD